MADPGAVSKRIEFELEQLGEMRRHLENALDLINDAQPLLRSKVQLVDAAAEINVVIGLIDSQDRYVRQRAAVHDPNDPDDPTLRTVEAQSMSRREFIANGAIATIAGTLGAQGLDAGIDAIVAEIDDALRAGREVAPREAWVQLGEHLLQKASDSTPFLLDGPMADRFDSLARAHANERRVDVHIDDWSFVEVSILAVDDAAHEGDPFAAVQRVVDRDRERWSQVRLKHFGSAEAQFGGLSPD